MAGTLCEKAANDLGLPSGIAIGSGVIDAYAGWIGTVGAKVSLGDDQLDATHASNDQSQAFSRLAAVAGTSTCHLVMSQDPVFVDGVWGPYRDSIIPDFWMAEGGQSATGELYFRYFVALSIPETVRGLVVVRLQLRRYPCDFAADYGTQLMQSQSFRHVIPVSCHQNFVAC